MLNSDFCILFFHSPWGSLFANSSVSQCLNTCSSTALQGFCVLGQGVLVDWVFCFFFPRDLQCKKLHSYLIFKRELREAVTMEIKGEGEWTVSP